jgi:hypothetical protein
MEIQKDRSQAEAQQPKWSRISQFCTHVQVSPFDSDLDHYSFKYFFASLLHLPLLAAIFTATKTSTHNDTDKGIIKRKRFNLELVELCACELNGNP